MTASAWVVLRVPDVTGLDTLAAALAYAAAGWYVLPVKRGSKHPGSVVGFGWNDQSSREPAVIIAWFAGSDYGIALHCGRSGAVVIDLDAPENMPAEMRVALLASDPPMQATRRGDDLRGHYLYLQPEGRVLGNGTGQLGAGWGDVRGLNGVIIVAPSVHEAPDGEYRWMQTGPLAALPAALADKLHDASPSEDAASDAEIAAFVLAHTASSSPHLADAWLAIFRKEVAAGESRHGKGVSIGAGALKEAAAGLFSAAEFIPALHREFIAAAARPPLGVKQGKARTGKVAESEWAGILAWAVAQARSAEVGATLARLAEHAPGMAPSWVHGAAVPQPAPAVLPRATTVPPSTALSVPPSGAVTLAPDEAHAQLVTHEMAIQRARREAKRLLDDEEHAARFRVPPGVATLTTELALPDEHVYYPVAEIMPSGANVTLTAQFKSGKSTVVNNLARSYADGVPLFGELAVEPLASGERVALWNYEVGRMQYRRWLRDTAIENTDAVSVLNLRGFRIPIDVPRVEDWCVAWLIEHQIRIWIVDPFARAFTGENENDNSEVGRWLDAVDVIKERAGIREFIMPLHTGRAVFEEGQERARAATRLDDWPDVRWILTKNDIGERFFSATGRDVNFAERQLSFDESTRCLTTTGGDRKAARLERYKNAVAAAAYARPGMSVGELREYVKGLLDGAEHTMIDRAAREMGKSGHLRIEIEGRGKATRHYPATPRPFGEPR